MVKCSKVACTGKGKPKPLNQQLLTQGGDAMQIDEAKQMKRSR